MPSPTHTWQMLINSKIYKIKQVYCAALKKYLNSPKSPTPHGKKAPSVKYPKGHPTDKRTQGKGPADKGLESEPHHRKNHARKVGDQEKSDIHPSPYPQNSRPQPKGTIQRMTAIAIP